MPRLYICDGLIGMQLYPIYELKVLVIMVCQMIQYEAKVAKIIKMSSNYTVSEVLRRPGSQVKRDFYCS